MKEDSAPESLAPPAQTANEPCPTIEQAEIDTEDKAASSLQAAGETLPGGPSPAEPPGLEGLGDSSTIDGAEIQPGLLEDVPTVKPPPKGKGRRVLRGEELAGLPEDICVECLTGNIEEDFKTFKIANPQFDISPQSAWNWFKDVKKGIKNR